MLEGQVATMGTFLNWVINKMNFFSSPEEINTLAESCQDAEDVLVLPTPSGLRFPYFEPHQQALIGNLGFRHDRSHLARGIIEGMAHRIMDILEGIKEDTGVDIKVIKVDGGVSQSDPLMQCLADLSQVTVERAPDYDVAVRGAAYLAGLNRGFWINDDEIAGLSLGYQNFTPKNDQLWAEKKRNFWKKSLKNQL